jgi:uncharacterized protein (TIGR00106 family)
MAIAEISIVPVGTKDPSYGGFVEAAVEACASAGVRRQVGALSTLLEGDVDAILACARRMHQAVIAAGADRVVTHLALEERIDDPVAP